MSLAFPTEASFILVNAELRQAPVSRVGRVGRWLNSASASAPRSIAPDCQVGRSEGGGWMSFLVLEWTFGGFERLFGAWSVIELGL
jgi:hypothetical protein